MIWLMLGGAVAVGCGFALLVAWIVDHVRPLGALSADDDRTGVKIGAAFAVYGVILGFAVVAAQQTYTDTEYALRQEAGAAATALRLAESLPPDAGEAITDSLRSYLTAEIADWESLASAERDAVSSERLAALFDAVGTLNSQSELAQAQDALYEALAQMTSGRTNRVLLADDGSPMIMWVLLLGGGVVVIAMAAILHFESQRLRLRLLVGMAALISVALFTIWALSHPFGGPMPVGFEPLSGILGS